MSPILHILGAIKVSRIMIFFFVHNKSISNYEFTLYQGVPNSDFVPCQSFKNHHDFSSVHLAALMLFKPMTNNNVFIVVLG